MGEILGMYLGIYIPTFAELRNCLTSRLWQGIVCHVTRTGTDITRVAASRHTSKRASKQANNEATDANPHNAPPATPPQPTSGRQEDRGYIIGKRR